jgi:SnoaL-like domain
MMIRRTGDAAPVKAFRLALETRDVEAALALVADDVVFRSPVVFRPYRGSESVRQILSAVFGVFDEWRCTREIGARDDPDHGLVFEARIGQRQIEGCDFLHLDENDLIDEFYVMVRPLSGALALAEAMKDRLARKHET